MTARARLCAIAPLLLVACASPAVAWHDTGHMIVAQTAYQRLTPAARARVDGLLTAPPGKRPLIHLCSGPYSATCEKTYDPITIATWMDDFRGDSLNEPYAPWHYINFRPVFAGVPERPEVGPEPENVLARIAWSIDVLRQGTGSSKKDAETLGFLYHLAGDVHQPLHASTRYTATLPDGDAGGNLFKIQMPEEAHIANLHAFWDAAAGAFGWERLRRPLDANATERLVALASAVTREFPPETVPEWKDLDPHTWVLESNTLARQVAYVGVKEDEMPSRAYTDAAQKLSRRRIAIAGYRLAAVLNGLFIK